MSYGLSINGRYSFSRMWMMTRKFDCLWICFIFTRFTCFSELWLSYIFGEARYLQPVWMQFRQRKSFCLKSDRRWWHSSMHRHRDESSQIYSSRIRHFVTERWWWYNQTTSSPVDCAKYAMQYAHHTNSLFLAFTIRIRTFLKYDPEIYNVR